MRASAHATANSRISLLFHFVFFSLLRALSSPGG
jgi:hypothetical protein